MSAGHKIGLAAIATACAAALLTTGALPAAADDRGSFGDVPYANPWSGIQNNVLSPGLRQTSVAWGSLPLTNPDTGNGITNYGYNFAALKDTTIPITMTQNAHEAWKTEPDKNVYLVIGGHHYLYQGHETGTRGYVTRVDLDATTDATRVTLITDVDNLGAALPTFDGITWDPFTSQLLLTSENKFSGTPRGGVWAVMLDASGNPTSAAVPQYALGSGAYEGIQNDSDGNLWIAEDNGGAASNGGKLPNTFIYRFIPTNKADLAQGGVLQALQVIRKDNTPATWTQLQNPADPFEVDVHTYGNSFKTGWVTVHTGTAAAAFDASGTAQTAGATPFKRPENGVFRPGSNFGEFYFTETGDTTSTSNLPGAYGAVFRLSQKSPSATTGTLSPFWLGDIQHTGFDNIQFASRDTVLVVEDAGDGLHKSRNALDSGYAVQVSDDSKAPKVTRWLAEGRDSSAYYDSASNPGYNDGDNEITGIHVSDGDPSVGGILGAKSPNLFDGSWRGFWTQQHGDNITWELLPVTGDNHS